MSVSVRPRWNQGVPVWESHNKHRALLTNASNSESGETDGSCYHTDNKTSSLQLKRGLPGRGFGTPKRLPSDRPYTDSNGVLGLGLLLVLVLGVCKSKSKPQHKPDTPTHNQAKRYRGISFVLRPRRMSNSYPHSRVVFLWKPD